MDIINSITQISIGVIPAFISYFAARHKGKVDLFKLEKENKSKLDELTKNHEIDIENLKEQHKLDMEAKDKEQARKIELMEKEFDLRMKELKQTNNQSVVNSFTADFANKLVNNPDQATQLIENLMNIQNKIK